MCGIVGYIGYEQATPLLLNGLKKLEYRGYDSSGIAIHNGKEIELIKEKGRISSLEDIISSKEIITGTIGIGHTRWATHGEPSIINSHPHVDENKNFAIVHNGIIENYLKLKDYLIEKGVKFSTDTDTEVVVQLIGYLYNGNLLSTVIETLKRIEGSYALGIVCKDNPDELIAAKKDSPLIIGLGKKENFIASDIGAVISKTKDIIRLNDGEIAVLKRDSVTVYNLEKEEINKKITHVNWNISSAEKDGYPHFMLKEIYEQPKAIKETIMPRIKNKRIRLDELSLTDEELCGINKICIIACGSAYHVGCIAKYVIEDICRKPVEIELASEFRYRRPIIDDKVLLIAISQSGETADTLAALREGKKLGAKTLSIVNVVGSSIANESDDVIYTWAGPEIAVATTKAYSTQLAVIYLLAVYIGDKLRLISSQEYDNYIDNLLLLPEKIEKILNQSDTIKNFADHYYKVDNVFFIGRNLDYTASLEGSLKLKEISYIHSEAYAAGELKHGTISLIENGTLVIAVSTQNKLFDKMISNMKEVKARGAYVLGITCKDNLEIQKVADKEFYIPKICDVMLPSLAIIPLQLFAYYVSVNKGCDVDKPKNLAKSVTVE